MCFTTQCSGVSCPGTNLITLTSCHCVCVTSLVDVIDPLGRRNTRDYRDPTGPDRYCECLCVYRCPLSNCPFVPFMSVTSSSTQPSLGCVCVCSAPSAMSLVVVLVSLYELCHFSTVSGSLCSQLGWHLESSNDMMRT